MSAKRTPAVAPIAPRLLDYAGAAAYLSIGKRGVEQLAKDGELPKITNITNKVLFDVRELDKYIDRKAASA